MTDSLQGDESREARRERAAMLDDLISAALPHVQIPGRTISLEDCYVYSCTQARTALRTPCQPAAIASSRVP